MQHKKEFELVLPKDARRIRVRTFDENEREIYVEIVFTHDNEQPSFVQIKKFTASAKLELRALGFHKVKLSQIYAGIARFYSFRRWDDFSRYLRTIDKDYDAHLRSCAIKKKKRKFKKTLKEENNDI